MCAHTVLAVMISDTNWRKAIDGDIQTHAAFF
uniref:Uncharacterized protein n=1 Tax=Anguilla anguilla TaxID=7936 RepID=A0A0E9QDU5_ANGAN